MCVGLAHPTLGESFLRQRPRLASTQTPSPPVGENSTGGFEWAYGMERRRGSCEDGVLLLNSRAKPAAGDSDSSGDCSESDQSQCGWFGHRFRDQLLTVS